MNDAEISRRLALAIGWDVLPLEDGDEVATVVDHANQIDRYFDYRDPAIIWPIAERFDCFPQKRFDATGWTAVTADAWLADENFCVADTAAKAVALAVIKAHEGARHDLQHQTAADASDSQFIRDARRIHQKSNG